MRAGLHARDLARVRSDLILIQTRNGAAARGDLGFRDRGRARRLKLDLYPPLGVFRRPALESHLDARAPVLASDGQIAESFRGDQLARA